MTKGVGKMDKTTDSSRLLRVIALEIGIMEELKSNSENL